MANTLIELQRCVVHVECLLEELGVNALVQSSQTSVMRSGLFFVSCVERFLNGRAIVYFVVGSDVDRSRREFRVLERVEKDLGEYGAQKCEGLRLQMILNVLSRFANNSLTRIILPIAVEKGFDDEIK